MPAGAELKRLRLAYNKSANSFAKQIGVDVERYRKWEQKDMNPREEDAEIVKNYFKIKSIDDLSTVYKLPNSSGNKDGTQVGEDIKKEDEGGKNVDVDGAVRYDLEIELRALIQTNKLLAEAHKIFAEANLKLATTNERLSVMANYSSTAFSHQQIPEAFDTMTRKLLELIADGLTVKKPRTREEAIALLSKVYHDDIPGMI